MDTTRFTVVAPEPIEAMPSIGNQNSCFGEADASIVIPDSLLVGGTGDLSVTVLSPVGNPMGGGTFTDDGFELSGLVCLNGDGTYEVTTTDDNGCFRVDTCTSTVRNPLNGPWVGPTWCAPALPTEPLWRRPQEDLAANCT